MKKYKIQNRSQKNSHSCVPLISCTRRRERVRFYFFSVSDLSFHTLFFPLGREHRGRRLEYRTWSASSPAGWQRGSWNDLYWEWKLGKACRALLSTLVSGITFVLNDTPPLKSRMAGWAITLMSPRLLCGREHSWKPWGHITPVHCTY